MTVRFQFHDNMNIKSFLQFAQRVECFTFAGQQINKVNFPRGDFIIRICGVKGDEIAVGTSSGKVCVVNTATKEITKVIQVGEGLVYGLGITEDREHIITFALLV